jgi:hypothetical protein
VIIDGYCENFLGLLLSHDMAVKVLEYLFRRGRVLFSLSLRTI